MVEAVAVTRVTIPVTLPGGYIHEGKVYRDAEVAGMTGFVRKQLQARKSGGRGSAFLTTVLMNCVTRIGPISPVTPTHLDNLVTADRDFLLIQVRRASLGDEVAADLTCGNCGKKHSIVFKVSDVPVTPMKDDRVKIVDGSFQTTLENKDLGLKLTVRFPTFKDSKAYEHLDPAEGFHKVLEACTIDFNGKVGIQKVGWTDNLGVRELNWIIEQLAEVQPTVDLGIQIACEACQAAQVVPLDFANFLSITPTRINMM